MKEHIYTIPVSDGFRQGGECPFCTMYQKIDRDGIEFMLSPSYMEDDIRMETNAIGFCSDHYEKMYAEQNRLGLALMLHTHLQTINAQLDNFEIQTGKKKLFSKPTDDKSTKLVHFLTGITDSCYICNRVENTFARYVDTFFMLWKKDKEMVTLVENSNGFCLRHFSMLLEIGEKKLSGSEFDHFISLVLPLQRNHLKRVENDVDRFIKKYDYRNDNMPWENAKDALPRSLTKISSIDVE